MKKLNHTVFAIIILFSLVFISCEKKIEVSRYGAISGVVYDDSTQTPLANVRISTSPASSIVTSNEDGTFLIPKALAGETSVKAEITNRKTQSVSVNITANETVNVIFSLSTTDENTTISGTLENLKPADQSKNIAIDTTFLSWNYSNSLSGVTFNLFLYPYNAPSNSPYLSDIADTSVSITELAYETTYFWYVTAHKNGDRVSISEVHSFTTADVPDNHLFFAKDTLGSYEILSSTLNGNSMVRLTNNSAIDWNPSLNTTVNRVAFTSNRSLDFHIYHAAADGSNLVKVTHLPVTGYHNNGIGYCWGANGNGFLYSRFDKIFYINKDGSGLQAIKDTAPANMNWRELDWNGPTQKIVAQAVGSDIYKSAIYLMDQNGANSQLLVADQPGRTDHPVFSTDGTKILYTHDAQGFDAANGRQMDARIYLLDLTTMTTTDLSVDKPNGTNDLMPEFSPNNAQVIFVNTDNTGSGVQQVWKMDIDGDNRELIINNATMPFAD